MKKIILLLCFFSNFIYAGGQQLFLPNVPVHCIPAVEKALQIHDWEISAKTDTSITAQTQSSGGRESAEIRIFYRNGNLIYSGQAKKKVKKIVAAGDFKTVEIKTDIPDDWLENVRKDTLVNMDAIPTPVSKTMEPNIEKSKSQAPIRDNAGESVKVRLDKLRNLLEEGYISKKEYNELRKEILNSI